ncbi:(deoxy)nucleoside triphosphate pyrophosphohydrolase [Desulfovibrio mangrovi]|uniref:(deoxy)nucleoside triphosphate pyrophosphohydrolase n=1 Tax=Desulfovibrio mangrovi TaxID=2976983 RepID=UPI00224819DB|nr:(deoxy)nucleoside triphosphate pyrophosphohydrolase [Desulfovibrio mangrovi]UZP67023.1 (deoxy)nucleoside triphosphate pyrophosphohydrolase [Desulfovibrio mangrovi]
MKHITVVAGIVWNQGRFLAAKRPEDKPFAGFWEFPGGKIESGETPDHALVREFVEEMNITPTAWEYWREVQHEYPDLTVTLHFFHITDYDGTVHPLEGHEIGWFTHAEAMAMPFLEADIAIVDDLRHVPYAKPAARSAQEA